MPSLPDPDSQINVNLLWKERCRLERPEPLQATSDSMRWSLRCMHVGCDWNCSGAVFTDGEAASAVGEFHTEMLGHPVKLRVTIEFDAGVIRAGVR
jgi:hypothetical protein